MAILPVRCSQSSANRLKGSTAAFLARNTHIRKRAGTAPLIHFQHGPPAGYGQAIDLVAKNAVFPESEDLAYYTAFQRVVIAMKSFAQHAGEIAEMTFDTSDEDDCKIIFSLSFIA
jgi:hypothetical protein